jgi:hypothetical protein
MAAADAKAIEVGAAPRWRSVPLGEIAFQACSVNHSDILSV